MSGRLILQYYCYYCTVQNIKVCIGCLVWFRHTFLHKHTMYRCVYWMRFPFILHSLSSFFLHFLFLLPFSRDHVYNHLAWFEVTHTHIHWAIDIYTHHSQHLVHFVFIFCSIIFTYTLTSKTTYNPPFWFGSLANLVIDINFR